MPSTLTVCVDVVGLSGRVADRDRDGLRAFGEPVDGQPAAAQLLHGTVRV